MAGQGRLSRRGPGNLFPIGVTGSALDQIARAKRVCERCPVRAQCLDWALHTRQDAGIWGGMTEDERRILGRSRPRPTLPVRNVAGPQRHQVRPGYQR
jgi:WhiB family redox-sensing transcriptional regulator